MNVFVLGTGRCGSVTFIKACEHLDGFSTGHETRRKKLGPARVRYPRDHIEADNRLSWFLGQLGDAYDGRDVLYVHLKRDPDAVARSYRRRYRTGYRASIIDAFAHGLVMQAQDYDDERLDEVCRFYVDTVVTNVDRWLADRPDVRPSVELWLEDAQATFPTFLERIGASGDLDAAVAEWGVKHNAGAPRSATTGSTDA